jgi:hypothetical protein
MAYATCLNHMVNTHYGITGGRPRFGIMSNCSSDSDLYCSVRRAGYYNGVGEYIAPVVVTTYPVRSWTGYGSHSGHARCISGMFNLERGGCQLSPEGALLAAEDAVQFIIPPFFKPAGNTEQNPPVNPAVIAGLLNRLWSDAAAQPGYDGLPFPASDPITPAEVKAVQQAAPSAYPRVQDLNHPMCATCYAGHPDVGPVLIPDNGSLPSTSPVFTQNPAINPGTGTAPQLDLGPNPATPQPALEAAPSAASIIAPLFAMFPSLDGMTINTAGAACPTDSVRVDALDMTLVMDQHCEFAETWRGAIGAAMLAVWTAAAAVVLLRA